MYLLHLSQHLDRLMIVNFCYLRIRYNSGVILIRTANYIDWGENTALKLEVGAVFCHFQSDLLCKS